MLFSAQAVAAGTCPAKLRQDVIDEKFPRLLSFEFNSIYFGRYPAASPRLREFMQELGLEVATGGNPAAMLRTILAHAHQDPTFSRRYYLGQKASLRQRNERNFAILEARFRYLDLLLAAQPLRGDTKLLAEYLKVTLQDWNAPEGFSELKIEDLGPAWRQARAHYREKQAAPAAAPPALWVDDRPAAERRDDEREATESWKVHEPKMRKANDLVFLDGEDPQDVRTRMKQLSPDDFINVMQKSSITIFEEFAEIELYHFYIVHKPTGSWRILLNKYEMGLEFLKSEVLVPHREPAGGGKSQMVHLFLRNLLDVFSGKLDARFGAKFTPETIGRLRGHFKDLRDHLLSGHFRRDLFEDPAQIEVLNECLEAVGLAPLD